MADLLGADEPGPVIARSAERPTSFVLVADHSGREVPRALGDLGLDEDHRRRHIAWDIGIHRLTEALAQRLGSASFCQRYSRLVIDCNREPGRADAIPEQSDGIPIPANRALDREARAARIEAIHTPYHAAIAGELARRDAAGLETVLVALHSFTPAMGGVARRWHAGVLYGGGDERFAHAVLRRLGEACPGPVGDNEPYAMIGTDYTVPRHCFAAGRAYAELEIRQDLLETSEQRASWAELLERVICDALEDFPKP